HLFRIIGMGCEAVALILRCPGGRGDCARHMRRRRFLPENDALLPANAVLDPGDLVAARLSIHRYSHVVEHDEVVLAWPHQFGRERCRVGSGGSPFVRGGGAGCGCKRYQDSAASLLRHEALATAPTAEIVAAGIQHEAMAPHRRNLFPALDSLPMRHTL